MTTHPGRFFLLVAVAALALLSTTARRAEAQELKPLVILLLDTSNSMEYELGDASTFPVCYDATGSSTQASNTGVNPGATGAKANVAKAGCNNNGNCSGQETLATCPGDCAVCGDGACTAEGGETLATCPGDCAPSAVCGDGTCSATETLALCAVDCAVCGDGVCSTAAGETAGSCADCISATCGDGVCETGESCAIDCGVGCGDGACSGGETVVSCAADCSLCGDGTCSGNETVATCSADCQACGDGVCTASTEDNASCPSDCKSGSGGGGSTTWCDEGEANARHTRSRFIVAQEVLTGRYRDDEYYCCQVERSSQEPDDYIPYHYTVPSNPRIRGGGNTTGVTQVQDGIMDVYAEQVRFALLTYDNDPGSNRGNAGGFSYGPTVYGWDSGGKNAHSNRGNHGGYQTLRRGSGALKALATSEDVAVMREQNDDLQEEVRWLFPYGWLSPLASFIDDARNYINEDETIQNDACIDLRPKGVILLTDGVAHFEDCYVEGGSEGDRSPVSVDYDGDGVYDDCNALTFGNQTYQYPWWYYQTSPRMATKLFEETDFPVYVIGFNAGESADELLRNVAYAGQTCDDIGGDDCYYQASDEEQLRFAFEDIVLRMTANGTDPNSRSRPITTTRTSFRDARGGYYEISSSFKRSARRYRGSVERVTYACDASSGQFVQVAVEDFADTLADQAPDQRTILTSSATLAAGDAMPTLASQCEAISGCDADLLDYLSGVSNGGRPVLTDMYHGSPALAVGPELDLPVGTYRSFRAEHGDRDSILYVPTNGGLLHAFLLADINQDAPLSEGEELWAYVPRAIHDKLSLLPEGRQITVDGTPVVEDVRMYRDGSRTPSERWSTVLLGTLRGGGRGVFALDVTDPYEPRFLWEINHTDVGFTRLGNTYGRPVIGAVQREGADGSTYEQAVAIIPGGVSSNTHPGEGEAVFVVSLEDGELLRTFTATEDGEALAQVTGSAATSSDSPGTLMTRAFMGDARGRLLRLGFAGLNPDAWTLDVFYDPTDDLGGAGAPERIVTAPAIARDRANNLVIVYGSGDLGTLTPDPANTNFVASVTEEIAFVDGAISIGPQVNWVLDSSSAAFKLTGEPVIFNKTAYFPVLAAHSDECIGSAARLYGVHYTDTAEGGGLLSTVDLDGDTLADLYSEYAPGTVIFGLDITVRPTCFQTEASDGVYTSLANASPSQPQLVVQTGAAPYAEGTSPASTSSTPVTEDETIDKVRIDIPRPSQTLRPLSWGVIYD